jgi:hypothetical protein
VTADIATSAPVGAFTAVAHQLALAAATSIDPDAAVSPSLWQRAEPVYRDVASWLTAHPAVDGTVGRLVSGRERAPEPTTYRLLCAEIERLATADPVFAEQAWGHAARIMEYCRLIPHRGGHHDALPEPDSIGHQIDGLAATLGRRSAGAGRPDLTVVLGFRIRPGDQHRLRNLLACVAALHRQALPAIRMAIVAVEQDATPRLRDLLEPVVDRYVFAPNAGAYNYAWGRNVGVVQGPDSDAVCVLDVDMVVGETFAADCLTALDGEVGAVLPYDDVLYLDERSSSAACRALTSRVPLTPPDRLRGYGLREIRGGAVVTTRTVYNRVGGQDERFRGWGDEDNEFYFRLREVTEVRRLLGHLYHLDHPRPVMRVDGQRINAAPLEAPRQLGGRFGDITRHTAD